MITPDSSNTKLELNDEGLHFLSSIKTKLAIIGVAGRAKTGKSFLLNNMLSLPHNLGFKVGTDYKPGTKGILMWGEPQTFKINGENITVVYMDTEGLAAPGNFFTINIRKSNR